MLCEGLVEILAQKGQTAYNGCMFHPRGEISGPSKFLLESLEEGHGSVVRLLWTAVGVELRAARMLLLTCHAFAAAWNPFATNTSRLSGSRGRIREVVKE